MHAVSQSFAHRAPPATRTRVRWQPYNSLTTSCPPSSCRSPPLHPITPASSIASSSPSTTPLNEINRLRQALPSTQSTKEFSRDTPKNKYAVGLVDQSVKALCEIWRLQDIPSAFLSNTRPNITVGATNELASHQKLASHPFICRNTQLPSPISPMTHPSPPLSSSKTTSLLPSIPMTQVLLRSDTDTADSRTSLIPIKGFVHEVLRRSRTSGCVLQTALCYIEAIRPKIPELLRQEKLGMGIQGEPDLESRIIVATDEEMQREIEFCSFDSLSDVDYCDDAMDTVRVNDDVTDSVGEPRTSVIVDESTVCYGKQKPKSGTQPLPPLPPLPSPLLCPRRAFLASLILASKFTQDKCYSNRAWAKLSGLPAREIGRCERALGQALEWRLWVGKMPTPTQPVVPSHRPVARSRSEGSLLTPSSSGSTFSPCCEPDAEVRLSAPCEQTPPCVVPPVGRGLRKCRTLPSDNFIPQRSCTTSNPYVGLATYQAVSSSNPSQQEFLQYPPIPLLDNRKPYLQDNSGNQTTPMYLGEILGQSRSPDTPGLTYSPSSTESSSGERTIQMSTFLDDMSCPLGTQAMTATDPWPWFEIADGTTSLHSKTSPPVDGPNVVIIQRRPPQVGFITSPCPMIVDKTELLQSDSLRFPAYDVYDSQPWNSGTGLAPLDVIVDIPR